MTNGEMPKAWQANEAERSVIGAIILSPRMIDAVQSRLRSTDFLDKTLGDLYDFMLDMDATGEPVGDVAFLAGRLADTKMWEAIGKASGIGRLAVDCPAAANAAFYASQVRQASDRRRLAKIASELYEKLMDAMIDPYDALQWFEARVASVGFNSSAASVFISQAAAGSIGLVRKAKESKYEVGVQCGLPSVDNVTGGLFPGELVVIAARPSIGKSALGAQIAYHAATQGRPTLFVSLEMETTELGGRILSYETGIDGRTIRAARVTDQEIEAMENAVENMQQVPMHLWRPIRTTVAEIRAQARLMQASGGIALLMVDYLSLIKPQDPRAFRRDQLSQIGKDLKELASELDIPVVALAQLNRDSEGNKPKLSHLAESGTIEQDASSVWLLHREHRASTSALLMIEKSRNGVVGEVALEYVPEQTYFRDSVSDFQ